MDAAVILKKAREIISDPTKWTRNVHARRVDGSATLALEPDAVCFCSSGAVRKAIGHEEAPSSPYLKFLDRACGTEIESFNDRANHAEVLAVFDAAIALAEGKQS